jgi:putative transposase
VHDESKGRYGAPRIHAELRSHGRKRVARLMRAAGLRGKTPKRWRKTTIPDPAAATRADQIRRDLTADASKVNSRWCGDITYSAPGKPESRNPTPWPGDTTHGYDAFTPGR